GITGRPAAEIPLAIDQVMHRAMIDVYEDGTEAAAATAITIVRTSAALSPEPFRVDRPFLFYIVDDATGAILFQGPVVDPREGRGGPVSPRRRRGARPAPLAAAAFRAQQCRQPGLTASLRCRASVLHRPRHARLPG